jgi:Leucine-rich repeat (LRR) protein
MARSPEIMKRLQALRQTSYPRNSARHWLLLSVLATSITLTILGGITLGYAESDAGKPATRILHFPKDRSLGRIMVQDASIKRQIQTFHHWVDGADWHYLGIAQGDIVIPAGKRVKLSINETAGKDLSALAQLEPNDLYSLALAGSVNDSCMDHVTNLTDLRVLDLSGNITDRGMRNITKLKSLERLSLSERIGNAGLAHAAELPSLTGLYVGQTRITDEGLSLLARLTTLEELSLNGRYISDAGLVHLAKLSSLHYLILRGENFSDTGLAHLKNVPSLRILNLMHLTITDAGVRHLSGHAGLENLSLYETQVTNRGLAYLKSMPALKKLNVGKVGGGQARITDAGMTHLAQINSLEYLHLPNFGITDEGLATIAGLQNLKHLWVCGRSNSPLTDNGLRHISKLQSLEFLLISGTGFTNAGMDDLAKLTNLRELSLDADSMTNAGLAKLKTLKSLEKLSLGSKNVTISGLSDLGALTNISYLKVRGIKQDNSGLDISGLSKLDTLTISPNATRKGKELIYDPIRDEDLACLKKLKNLRWLQIGSPKHCMITDAGTAHLKDLTNITRLSIGSPYLTDKSLSYLANKNKLDWLSITGNFTDNGLSDLEGLKALHHLGIYSSNRFSSKARQQLLDNLPNMDRRHFTAEQNRDLRRNQGPQGR